VLREIAPGSIVNLGIGVPEAVASVAAETGRLGEFTLTLESGPIGGVPAGGLSFGCSAHPEAVIDQPSQFDFYDGGGLDVTVLGALEVDAEGCVNVTSPGGGRFAGVGGFVNISQSARRVIFACPFRADGLAVTSRDGALQITRDGAKAKFVRRVAQVCFHGPSAVARGQEVLYVTERAVFELRADGLHLRELAPGVDLHRDVLTQMDFAPHHAAFTPMPAECFAR
jgi:propionate CoA-transferase